MSTRCNQQALKAGEVFQASVQFGDMSGQTDREFRAVTITESSRNLHYNFLSSPVPFECPDTILSPPLSSSTPHTVRLEPDNRVFTPIPCQPRISTPYPVIDSVASAKVDWPGLSPENRLFPSSWGFEPILHIGQQFQGGVLPMATSNSQTVHHYSFPQTWHHAVTSPQNFSGHGFHSNDFWYQGDSSLVEGFGSVDERGNITEQDSKVTSSTESESPWKPELALPPVAELLNSSNGNIKLERTSPVEITLADEKYQFGTMQSSALHVKPKQSIASSALNDVRTQTPWKLKKSISTPTVESQVRRKGNPRKIVNPLVYSQQKKVQRERERAIRDKLKYLSTILPLAYFKNNRPSRKEILESAISRIMQLQEDIREAYLQKGLKTEDLKAALQGNMVFNLSNSFIPDADQQNDIPPLSSECDSLPSTPEVTEGQDLYIDSASPTSESSSQESEESDTALHSSKTEKNKHVKRPMNAFILFSKNHRTFFKHLYPGRDNRKISILLAEKWRNTRPEEKEPYKREAKELMRQTKESHPDFKYCEGIKKTGMMAANIDSSSKQTGLDQGYRIGSHTLRQRCPLYASGKQLKPASKKNKNQRDEKPNIQMKRLPRKANEILPATTFEAKSIQKVNMTPNIQLCQDSYNRNLVQQILQTPDHHSGPSGKGCMEWHPNTCDEWAQCENCKKWHMLPDEVASASLPDKWYCPRCEH